jgi:hypothetical protein
MNRLLTWALAAALCSFLLVPMNAALALTDADLATLCTIAQRDPAFVVKLQKECSGLARAIRHPTQSKVTPGQPVPAPVVVPGTEKPTPAPKVVTKAPPSQSGGTNGSGEPNPYFVFLRSSWTDVGILANPVDAQKAVGATVTFTNDYVAANRNWTAQGVLAAGFSNVDPITPGVTPAGWFDRSVAIYVQENSSRNSNATLVSKNSDTRTAGLSGELGYVDASGNNFQFLRATPSVTQDAIKGTTSVAIMGEYIPAFKGLWDTHAYFDGNINAQFDPELVVQYTSTTNTKNPVPFSGKSQSLRLGPEATLIVQPYSAGTNPILDRLAFSITFHPWYDTYARGVSYWWTNAIVYNLTTDGNFAVTAKYNRGLDDTSGQMTNQYILGLSGKL